MTTTSPTLATAVLEAAQAADSGVVYLLHFDRPYRHARHYTGFTHNWDARETLHILGEGARLLRVIQLHGIGWQLARTWPGTRATERALKRQGGASRRCPLCGVTPTTTTGTGGAS